MSKIAETFKKNVVARLREKGWSKTDLAKALNQKPSGIYTYLSENGPAPGIETLERWAVALGVAPEWLLGGEGKVSPEHEIDALKLKAISAIVSLVDIDDLGAIVDTIFEYLPPEERKKLSAP